MEIFIVIVGLVINGIIANIIGKIGSDKKIGYSTAFWVSFLLTPLLGILMVIASQPITEKERTDTEQKTHQTASTNRRNYDGPTFGGEIGSNVTSAEQLTIVATALIGLIIVIYIATK